LQIASKGVKPFLEEMSDDRMGAQRDTTPEGRLPAGLGPGRERPPQPIHLRRELGQPRIVKPQMLRLNVVVPPPACRAAGTTRKRAGPEIVVKLGSPPLGIEPGVRAFPGNADSPIKCGLWKTSLARVSFAS
jgi:hypothetical protein